MIQRNEPCFPGSDSSTTLDIRAGPDGTCSSTDTRWNNVDTSETEKVMYIDNNVNSRYVNLFASTSIVYSFASRSGSEFLLFYKYI